MLSDTSWFNRGGVSADVIAPEVFENKHSNQNKGFSLTGRRENKLVITPPHVQRAF